MKMIEMAPGRSVSFAAGALAALFLLAGVAFPQSEYTRSPGIWLSGETRYKLSRAHIEELTRSLRRITGYQELHFAVDGSLAPGGALSGGSETSRQILSRA